MNMKTKTAAALALLAATLVASSTVQATPITVDFSITSTDQSIGDFYQPGVVGSGYFTFDDALIPAGGTGHIGNSVMGAPTLDLSFNWFGVSFDETNAGIAVLRFTGGLLTDWWIGGNYVETSVCSPFMRYSCMSSAATAPDFSILTETGGGLVNDGVHNGLGSSYGSTIEWSVRSTSVPEPTTLALFGLGLAGVGFSRRRKAA